MEEGPCGVLLKNNIFMDMIKLTDLLKSMAHQQIMMELDIRRGQLKNIVSKEDVYTTFFEDFEIFDEDEFDIEAKADESKIRYKELKIGRAHV